MGRKMKSHYGNPKGKYAALHLYLIGSDAWRALGTASHSLFILLCLEWNGPTYNNNGRITLSVRQTAAEWLHRKLQRQPARRVAQRGDLRHIRRCSPQAGPLAIRLQKRQTALITRKPNTR